MNEITDGYAPLHGIYVHARKLPADPDGTSQGFFTIPDSQLDFIEALLPFSPSNPQRASVRCRVS